MNEKDRLVKLMENESISAAQFADLIGIQRSTLSHILNGRNAPSLDVLKRTLDSFRTISSDWLILGIGPMYRQINSSVQPTLFDVKPEPAPLPIFSESVAASEKTTIVTEQKTEPLSEQQEFSAKIGTAKTVTKVMLFYSDNTFEEFQK